MTVSRRRPFEARPVAVLMVEHRRFTIAEIARHFCVPEHLIAASSLREMALLRYKEEPR